MLAFYKKNSKTVFTLVDSFSDSSFVLAPHRGLDAKYSKQALTIVSFFSVLFSHKQSPDNCKRLSQFLVRGSFYKTTIILSSIIYSSNLHQQGVRLFENCILHAVLYARCMLRRASLRFSLQDKRGGGIDYQFSMDMLTPIHPTCRYIHV